MDDCVFKYIYIYGKTINQTINATTRANGSEQHSVCVCVVENVLRQTRDNREEDIGKIGMENGGGVWDKSHHYPYMKIK